ncbi:hypothetical protein DFP93_10850 [Aneurinibacillus soli]|uniref:Flagellar protein FliT n=1 Tax=Aneurinibacillus soli TaxID=1500254 RepID=A0A0U4WCL9_9BACL|nr:flagellar protein FliT [Aneurinibacillus soli]PYE61477.1 hypothetical protein DFP93_10850 [Aneurinibacillus soli]BAU26568.1 hypothetical protein CB4_00695 [Aneurinibacillus soli]
MLEDTFVHKERCLNELKQETQKQLAAVRIEDVSGFIRGVERCEQLIAELKEINIQASSVLSEKESVFEEIGQDILRMRSEISDLLPTWRERLRSQMLREQEGTRIKQVYDDDDEYVPPIFLDKRK